MNSKFKVEHIGSATEWGRLAEHWNALLSISPSGSVFLTWEWIQSWVQSFLAEGRDLFILTVHCENRIVAIAPWYIERVRCAGWRQREIRFLGSPETGSDYLDVIVECGREREVADAIYYFLFQEGKAHWDQLSLSDIPAESLFFFHFMNRIDEHGKFAEIRRHAFMPQVKLPKTAEDYLSALSTSQRARYRLHLRRLELHTRTSHITFRDKDVNEGMRRFFELYDAKSGYDGSALARFLQVFADSGAAAALQVDILEVEDRDVAGILHLAGAETLSLFLMATDKAFDRRISIGNILVGKCLAKAIESGFGHYDFLKGGEEYKFRWANKARTSLSLHMGQQRFASRVCTSVRLLRYIAKAMLR